MDESFAQSVLWGFKVEAEEGDRVLVDATAFFLRDAHGVVERLRQSETGQLPARRIRSALYLPRTKGFPKNTEVEATLTFTTDGDPGPLRARDDPVAAGGDAARAPLVRRAARLTTTSRASSIRASASFGIEFYDYASPINEPVEKRWITRHRLEKKDPTRRDL